MDHSQDYVALSKHLADAWDQQQEIARYVDENDPAYVTDIDGKVIRLQRGDDNRACWHSYIPILPEVAERLLEAEAKNRERWELLKRVTNHATEHIHERPWKPVDLSDVLAGTWQPPQPTVGRRTDGPGFFYPRKVHTVSSETEAGKTWMALSAVIDEIAAGKHVVYLDFEDDEGGVVGRLLALQVGRDSIRERFHYLRPTELLGTGINLDDLNGLIASENPSLLVIDGITEAMVLHGLNPLDNKEVATFGRILPRRIANLGPAVVCLDHVTKDREGRGRYAIGAVHKLNGLDGAAYVLENRAPFGIGLTGRSTIKIAKDRPGQLRKHGLPSSGGMHWYGDLVLESHHEDFAEVSIDPPSERDDDFRPTVLMGRILQALEQHGPMSQRKILTAVKGKRDRAIDALNYLILDGFVSEQTPHKPLKPYPQEAQAS